MAAVGILAALRERDRSGEGQLVDVSMADGSLSWLAMVAGRYFADGAAPQRGDPELAGALVCYRPYACADGWVTLGALEPKFWAAWCRGVGREDLIEQAVRTARVAAHAREVAGDLRRAHARAVAGLRLRARLLPGAGARPRRGARTPSSCARARWWSSSTSRAPRAGAPARPADQAVAHAGERARRPARRSGEHTHDGAARRPATPTRRSPRSSRPARWRARPRACTARSWADEHAGRAC